MFTRYDGTPGRVDRLCEVLSTGPPPRFDEPLVVQVSRWDRLKDHMGVMTGFAEHVAPATGAHLILAGPNVNAVADDPEGAEVLDEVWAAWRELPHARRSRVHLSCLPMADIEENAAIVNALQRHATVVVQKSLRRGSASPSRRRCGSRGPWWRARWAASRIRSRTASRACCSTTRPTSTPSASWCSSCCDDPELRSRDRRPGPRARAAATSSPTATRRSTSTCSRASSRPASGARQDRGPVANYAGASTSSPAIARAVSS